MRCTGKVCTYISSRRELAVLNELWVEPERQCPNRDCSSERYGFKVDSECYTEDETRMNL